MECWSSGVMGRAKRRESEAQSGISDISRPDSEDFHMPISIVNPVVNRPLRKDADFHTSPDSIGFVVI